MLVWSDPANLSGEMIKNQNVLIFVPNKSKCIDICPQKSKCIDICPFLVFVLVLSYDGIRTVAASVGNCTSVSSVSERYTGAGINLNSRTLCVRALT